MKNLCLMSFKRHLQSMGILVNIRLNISGGVALNLINLILHKEIKKNDVLKNIGVTEDCYVSMPHFGNSGGGNYQVWSRLFIAKDHMNKDEVLGISICGTIHTENDPHWGNRSGSTQLNISIANKESRHHSLQLNLDRYCRYNPITNIVDIVHNGFNKR